jgi:hypothetical protein
MVHKVRGEEWVVGEHIDARSPIIWMIRLEGILHGIASLLTNIIRVKDLIPPCSRSVRYLMAMDLLVKGFGPLLWHSRALLWKSGEIPWIIEYSLPA